MEELISSEKDPEIVLEKAARVYENWVMRMRSLIVEIENFRVNRKIIPARKIWQLGDAIFRLIEDLKSLSLQIDGVYDHLMRDLGVKRMWLEKVIIFRRYLPEQDVIPESLNWGRCRNEPRRAAEKLRKGLPPKLGN
jgi:hypothetical protein